MMFNRNHEFLQSAAGDVSQPAGRERPSGNWPIELDFAQLSDTGKVREGNEDFIGYALPQTPAEANARGWLFALADGVGGGARGEVASRTAIESVLAGFRESRAGEPPSDLLPRLVRAANSKVYDAGRVAGTVGGSMSTTLVAAVLRLDHVAVAHVGDSRCYLVRRGRAVTLTSDHTVAAEQVGLGVLSAEEAAEAPTRHMLSRSLGSELTVEVETSEHGLLPGDVLVLCSDGLHGPVTSAEIVETVGRDRDLDEAARRLASLANERDGSDNVSVLLIRIRRIERVGMYRGRPYRLA